ncbi:hypothetical protein BN946_scf184986.g7 [Trametes cinnabarina]|uniref:Senescence domain-containing protein n=1 Tax=Pycnoporus cinnabarinus TaxID=5643 RepID=A0A060SWP9_PYCCI|nr:hypothetical protein BN946_scf184986.g7 [Trametes cinnabarina]
MTETFITIPGVTAHHVLADMNVTLGAGDLNLMAEAGGGRELKLTVGGAAFSLDKKTEFGTLEGDSRAYIFKPDIEGVSGGYVKLTLPEGVMEDGSQLSELQTRFEEILIAHGMLQPAEEASARKRIKDAIASQDSDPLVSIPSVIAAQVLGEETTVLSEGTLRLDVIPQQEGTEIRPLLTLSVGSASFPLFKSTTFGTLTDDSRTYLFTPEVEGVDKGFVAVALPEGVEDSSADLAELQNSFELALIEYGLLKDGFEAAADEVGRSVIEDSARTAQRIREAKDFAAARTQSIANAAHWVSGAVTSAASSAGAWMASTFVATDPAVTEKLESAARGASAVATGVMEGTRDVKDTLKTSAGDVVENDYGEEAREVAGNAGQSVNNVGAVAGDVATVTSGAALAVAGLQGAAGRQYEEQHAGQGAKDQ